jgi:hypothetical protein
VPSYSFPASYYRFEITPLYNVCVNVWVFYLRYYTFIFYFQLKLLHCTLHSLSSRSNIHHSPFCTAHHAPHSPLDPHLYGGLLILRSRYIVVPCSSETLKFKRVCGVLLRVLYYYLLFSALAPVPHIALSLISFGHSSFPPLRYTLVRHDFVSLIPTLALLCRTPRPAQPPRLSPLWWVADS